jgi:small-conductance mechanosensitive channel
MPSFRLCILSIAATLVLGGSAPLFGQDSSDAGSKSVSNAEVRLAEVVVDGETLFSVRGVTAHPAEVRASQIEERIRTLAANPKVNAESLRVEEHPGASWIMADGQRIMAVLDEDAAVEEIARGPLAELHRARIWQAIELYRSDRHPDYLLRQGLYATGMTAALLIAALLGRRIERRLRAAIERRYQARIEGLEDRSHHIVKVQQIWRALTGFLNLVWGVGLAVMVYAYLTHVLALFPWTRGFARSLFAIALDPLRTMGSGLVAMIPNLVFLAILIVVICYAMKVIRVIFDGLAAGTLVLKGFDPEWAWPTYRLVRILIILFAAVVAYPYIPGSESGAFKGISLFAGVLFSLGSSSLIGNMIAGYTMTYRRAFRLGDRVKIGEHVGDIERMRLLVTHLRTPKNEEVVVPNSTILSNEIVNYSSMAQERGLILHTTVGVGYETPWRQVEAMLLEAARRTAGLRPEPVPFVLKQALGDFCVTYEINGYCDKPRSMVLVYTELHGNILDVFNEYGVQIMTPAYEGDPEEPKVVPKERWYTAPASAPQKPSTTDDPAINGRSGPSLVA